MSIDEVVRTIFARGYIAPTQAELAQLRAAPESHVPAQKILGAHAFNRGEFDVAVRQARQVLKYETSAETANALISSLVRAKLHDDALDALDEYAALLEPLELLSKKSEICAHKGDSQRAVRFGREALAMKDAAAPASPPNRPPVQVHPFRPQRSLLSFSLFGSHPRYLEGALRNAIVARHLYPGWTVRFYVDDSVPEAALKRLIEEGAQVYRVSNQPAGTHGLFWRFMPEDDDSIDIYVVRDADSIISIKERVAVGQWLESGQPFHIMRDFLSHSELMLAGMWGAHRGNIGSMAKRVGAFLRSRGRTVNDRSIDQRFLQDVVWPLTRGRACCHDPVFAFNATHRVPSEYDLPGDMHIGQNAIGHLKNRMNRGGS